MNFKPIKISQIAVLFLLASLVTACSKQSPPTSPTFNQLLTAPVGSSVDLGELPQGKTKLFTVALENSSSEDIIGPISFPEESYYSVLAGFNCPLLKANSRCIIKIYFDGKGITGSLNETLTIGGQTVSLLLNVLVPTVEPPNLLMVSEVNFGMLNNKNVIIKTLRVKNLGTQTISGQQAVLNLDGGFIIYDVCSGREIKPKASCMIKVVLDSRSLASEGDPVFGTLSFAGYSVSLIGNVLDAGASPDFEESSVNFNGDQSNEITVSVGIVNPPFTLFKILTFVNDGTETTTPLTADFTPGEGIFLLANSCQGASLAPQGSCSIKLAMPSSTGYGDKTATLNMGEYTINLEGSVIMATIYVPPTPVTSYSVPGLPADTVIVNLPVGCSQDGSLITCSQPTVIPPPKLACASQHIYQNGQCVLVSSGDGGNSCPSGQIFDGNTCVDVVYEARSFSPYSPTPQICGGIVHQQRSILTCFRVDTDQQVQNTFCSDPLAAIDTPSPAGAIADLNIVGGVQHRGCDEGESTPHVTGVDCVPGYLQQGDLCIPYNLQVPSTKGFNGAVQSIVTLSTGEIIYGGSFDTFTDNDNTIYTLKGVAKFSSAGQIDTTFINNVGSNITGGGMTMVVDTADNIYGVTNGGSLWKMNSAGVIDTTFKTNTNNKVSGVKALVLDGQGNLFIGGNFTSFGGITNNARGLAKLSTDGVFNQTFSDNMDVVPGTKANTSGITGVSSSNYVAALAIDGAGNLYAGGSFYGFGGVNYNANKILKISSNGVFDQAFSDALDVTPGTKITTSGFYNAANVSINKIVVSGSDLYVGGGISHFKGQSFRAMKIAKLTTSGVFDQSFSDNLDVNPGSKSTNSGFNDAIRDIVLDNGALYVVGDFTQFKNVLTNANHVAKLSTSGVFDQTFSDGIDGIAGVKGAASGFNAVAYCTMIKGSDLYVGGAFDSFRNQSAKYTAKLSAVSGAAITFIASSSLFNATVSDIKQDADGNTYFVGTFTYYNGVYAPRIVKLNSDFQVDNTFMQNIGEGFNSSASTIAIDSSRNVYIGGAFTTFNNVSNINRIVKLSPTGVLDNTFMNNLDVTPGVKASSSGFNSSVYVLKVGSDGNLYVGGGFTRVRNNLSAKYLSKLSLDGVLDATFLTNYGATGLNNSIYGLGLDADNNIYITGVFTSFGGIANNANGLAKFSTDGVFNQAFSDALDVVPGTKTTTSGFTISAGTNQGQGILVYNNMLFVVGSLAKYQNVSLPSRGISKFDLNGVFDQGFKTTMGTGFGGSATILSVDTDGTYLYVGGSFSGWNNVSYTARNFAKLSLTGVLNQDFMDHMNADYQDSANPGTANANSGFTSTVQTVTIGVHGELLIGGQFQSFKQLKYERAIILNVDGTLPVQ